MFGALMGSVGGGTSGVGIGTPCWFETLPGSSDSRLCDEKLETNRELESEVGAAVQHHAHGLNLVKGPTAWFARRWTKT